MFIHFSIAVNAVENPPKLIVQITVDALRGDLPTRYMKNMGKGGFRYLLNEGVYYSNAHYQHANTETIVGHVSLATGAPPSVHGMVGNVWYDRALNRQVYNIEDPNYHLLGDGGVDQKTELDATQKVAQGDGRSPIPFLSSTFSDELASAYQGKSKIFAVSVKDRGAVSFAGQFGKAYWFSKASKKFVTSSYYYQQYPTWVEDWNKLKLADKYHNDAWQLMFNKSQYIFGNEGDVSYKTDIANYGRSFPHAFGSSNDPYYSTKLTLSPVGDELTLEFARTLIEKEQLGQDDVPDYLSLSFSSNDYIIHIFGPSSIEAEDNLLRLDRTLANLFSYLDKKVGLENTLIVLSADHGASEAPEYLTNIGAIKPKYFDINKLKDKALYSRLKKKFGLGKELFKNFSHPYIYLDHTVIKDKKLDLYKVQQAVANELVAIEGIEQAINSIDIEKGSIADTRVAELVKNNHYSSRSGDIYLVFSPNIFINDFDGLAVTSTHGSPWRYDTHVPVIFAGASIKKNKIVREVTPYDIAPTLSNYLGITQPSGTTGNVLFELIAK
ncbi:MAG: alkaline phosphatase family protein [Colwellia sp.]